VQTHQRELANVEPMPRVAAPGRLYESLSAFANRTGGLDVHQRQKVITRIPFLDMEATMGPRLPVHKLNGHWA